MQKKKSKLILVAAIIGIISPLYIVVLSLIQLFVVILTTVAGEQPTWNLSTPTLVVFYGSLLLLSIAQIVIASILCPKRTKPMVITLLCVVGATLVVVLSSFLFTDPFSVLVGWAPFIVPSIIVVTFLIIALCKKTFDVREDKKVTTNDQTK